ncbi:type IV secretory system conjugative DNA transfer family protein [Acanthopleuribacter pedis]|uniref:Type IV secretion system DNA-binding domain-containing protein n=1 Tax=Acanthopleuribacter pedis TaxID=442870 RepID=A0A8J7QLC5_9BACT|nr:type IV secretion system DNA-binding domain-containing protein [Acanthopleuribacter pedis]MBO1321995.1 type IV secretion system DNA-binding domain-containing protein [Acanthopleuribacter pedis]
MIQSAERLLLTNWNTYWREAQGAADTDLPIGETTLQGLSASALEAFCTYHNRRLDILLKGASKSHSSEFITNLRNLKIPNRQEFAELRSDQTEKHRIPAHLRGQARLVESWHEWVFSVPPLSSIYRDYARKKRIAVYLPESAQAKHGLLLGQTGSGKSELLKALIMRDVAQVRLPGQREGGKRAVVLIEPTGNLSRDVAKQAIFWVDYLERQNQGEESNLILFDPTLAAEEGLFPSFNPFDRQGQSHSPQQIDTQAQFLTTAFLAMLNSNTELSLHQATLLHPLMVLLLSTENSRFTDLADLLRGESDFLQTNAHLLPEHHRKFLLTRLYHRSFDRTRSSLETKLTSLLNFDVFRRVVCQKRSSFGLQTILDRGQTLIVSLPKGAIGSEVASCIGRLFLASILAVAFGRSHIPPEERIPIHVYLDEAHNFLGDTRTVPETLAEARQFLLRLFLAQQYLGQNIDRDMLRAIVSNTNVKIVGKSTVTTAKTMSSEMRISPDSFHDLRPGQFVVQCGSKPATTCQVFDTHLGTKTEMTSAQWNELRQAQICDYYRENKDVEHQGDPHHDTQLHEEMAGSKVPLDQTDEIEPPFPDAPHFDLDPDPGHEHGEASWNIQVKPKYKSFMPSTGTDT